MAVDATLGICRQLGRIWPFLSNAELTWVKCVPARGARGKNRGSTPGPVNPGPDKIGKPQRIGNIPSYSKGGDTRNCKRPDDQIAHENAEICLRRKGTGKALSAALLGFDKAAQLRLVGAVRQLMPAMRGCELPRQHIGRDHR